MGRKIARPSSRKSWTRVDLGGLFAIELRLLAHVADIPQLKKPFAAAPDIHAMTASEMFGVAVEGMPSECGAAAKEINFASSTASRLRPRLTSSAFRAEEPAPTLSAISSASRAFRDYMDTTRATVREHGVVTTIFGRNANFPKIASSNASERAFLRTRGDQRADSGRRRRLITAAR